MAAITRKFVEEFDLGLIKRDGDPLHVCRILMLTAASPALGEVPNGDWTPNHPQ